MIKGVVMSQKKYVRLVAAALALFTGAAEAETVTFQFKGTITYGSPMAVPVGTQITGTFSYDTKTSPAVTYKGYASYQIPAPNIMSASVGSHKVVTENLSVSVWNHFKGNVEDMVDVTGGPVVLDGTTFSNSAFGFRLASGPHQNNVLNSTDLPQSFDVSKFDAGSSLTYGFLQSDGGQTGTLLQFTVDSIAVIPTAP
jgi:hypothetical protein